MAVRDRASFPLVQTDPGRPQQTGPGSKVTALARIHFSRGFGIVIETPSRNSESAGPETADTLLHLAELKGIEVDAENPGVLCRQGFLN